MSAVTIRGRISMFSKTTFLGALLAALVLVAAPVAAQEDGGHSSPVIEKQPWSFAGVFGTFDENQLQRGFQVFREVCASCHGARLMAFRNLYEHGGPGFSEEQVKALAAEYEIADPSTESGVRPAVPADRWPSPFANEIEARAANGGALPPDFSVLAKARSISQPFPWWLLNYVTPYAEGGPDYIYALLTGYHDEPPAGVEDFPEDKYYNDVYPGHAIGMAPPLSDGQVIYEEGEGSAVPATVDQYSRDVAAFMMWMAEPHLVARKEAGLRVMLFLFLFAGLMYAVKRRLWSRVH
jgi:ubiquinol-cytochrome c reductase cytochrome c1 subunit